jgi:hypothetical protein
METLQAPVSENHKSSMFFDGVVAYGKAKNGNTYVLTTEGMGEISYNGKTYLSSELRELALEFEIDDDIIDAEDHISVFVDNWFVIAQARGTDIEDILHVEDQDEDRIFDNYDEAIEGFQYFLDKQ